MNPSLRSHAPELYDSLGGARRRRADACYASMVTSSARWRDPRVAALRTHLRVQLAPSLATMPALVVGLLALGLADGRVWWVASGLVLVGIVVVVALRVTPRLCRVRAYFATHGGSAQS